MKGNKEIILENLENLCLDSKTSFDYSAPNKPIFFTKSSELDRLYSFPIEILNENHFAEIRQTIVKMVVEGEKNRWVINNNKLFKMNSEITEEEKNILPHISPILEPPNNYYYFGFFTLEERKEIEKYALCMQSTDERDETKQTEPNKWRYFGVDWDVALYIFITISVVFLVFYFLWKWLRSFTTQ